MTPSWLIFLDVVSVIVFFIVLVLAVVDLVMRQREKLESSEREQEIEQKKGQGKDEPIKEPKIDRSQEDEHSDRKIDFVAQKVISGQIKRNEIEKQKEEKDRIETMRELERTSLLNNIIIDAWKMREKMIGESTYPIIDIVGRKENEKIKIGLLGNGQVPDIATITLINIPGFPLYRHGQLVDYTDKEKEIIEKWILANYAD